MPAFALIFLAGCGGSGEDIPGPNANSLSYAAPIQYALTPVGYGPQIFNSLGHAACSSGGSRIAFWSDPSSVKVVTGAVAGVSIFAMNAHDQIVGDTVGPGHQIYDPKHAFVYDANAGTMTMLKEPAGTGSSSAFSINDKGEILASTSLPSGSGGSYVYYANKDADPVVIDSSVKTLQHIDNFGRIISTDFIQMYVASSRTATPKPFIPLDGTSYISLRSVSPNGLVAGSCGISSLYPIATFWAPGSTKPTQMSPVVGYAMATITAANDAGFATGYFPNQFKTNSAFIYSGGTAIDLKNVVPQQDGWDFVQGLYVDGQGNITLQGWKNGAFSVIYLKRIQ